MSALNEILSGSPAKNSQDQGKPKNQKLSTEKASPSLSNDDEIDQDIDYINESCSTREEVHLFNKTSFNDNISSNTSGLGLSILSPTASTQYQQNQSPYSIGYISGNCVDKIGSKNENLKVNQSDVKNISSESLDGEEIEDSISHNALIRENSLSSRSSDDEMSSREDSVETGSKKHENNSNGSFSSLPLGLSAAGAAVVVHHQPNIIDFDPFNNYTCGSENKEAEHANLSEDSSTGKRQAPASQLDQQLIALASTLQTSNQANSNTITNTNDTNQRSSSSSLLENIELLTAKYKQQQAQQNQHHHHSPPMDSSCLNSLILAMASTGLSSNGNLPDLINSPQFKRQNTSSFINNFPQNSTNVLFSTPIATSQNATSPSASNTNLTANSQNSRLNSTPNLVSINANSNLASSIMNDQQPQNRFFSRGHNSSMSASNSTYNLSSPTSTSIHSHHVNHSPQGNDSSLNSNNQNNSSMFDDDDVFSPNTGFSPSLVASQAGPNSQEAIAQLYRSIIRSNLNSANINELINNHSLMNLSNVSLGSDGVLNTNNSANFINVSGNTTNNANASVLLNQLNQFKNNLNYGNNSPGIGSSSNLSPIATAAAFLKQQKQPGQNGNNNVRIGNSASLQSSPMLNSNIAALTSATSNMASLLSTVSSSNQHQFDLTKRRVNSVASSAFNFPNSNSNGSNHSSNLLTQNAGPNATMLLQNSSLASSARLNMSSSSTASVLGSNSALTQTLNAIHQQQNTSSFSVHQSPSGSSSHNLLSALSLSTANANSKPLRSERLPPHMVDEIIKQSKIRRKQGGKKEVCVFCRNNSEKEQFYTSHTLKDASNNVACPILRLYQCPICHASGDQAHTIKYCPYAEKDSAYIKLFKDSGKISAAAALFMNSLSGSSMNGVGTPSSNTPPDTPSPISHQGPPNLLTQGNNHLNFLNSSQVSSPSSPLNQLSVAQAISNFQNSTTTGSLNKSFSGAPILAANLFNTNSNNSVMNKSN